MNSVWEQRWHPLREEWVVIAAHRQDRPWTGATVANPTHPLPEYGEDCYLCPANYRVSGKQNPHYRNTFVFDNDLPCVGESSPAPAPAPGIYRSSKAQGMARVVCYTPKHNLSLSVLSRDEIAQLLSVLRDQYRELGSRPEIAHVLIFENKGEVVGVSNPHPHCQIYATNFVFKTIETEARVSQQYLSKKGRVLFQEILDSEYKDGRRIICENDSAVAFIPYFARYAYEVFVSPKSTYAGLPRLSASELYDLAGILKRLLVRLDNLWQLSFPYVMVFHQAPTDGGDYAGFHFHIEFHPPLRKPGLVKYLAGPEIGGGNFLSDTCPEERAAELREQPEVHFLEREVGD